MVERIRNFQSFTFTWCLTMTENKTPTKRTPSIDELIELPVPADARISAGGEYVAYTLTRPDWKENEFVSQIWLASAGGGEPRQLTFAPQSSSSPRWSPDGQWLAFLSRRQGDDSTQVYRISPYGGEAERLSDHSSAISAFDWSPDSRSIAFIAGDIPSAQDRQREEAYGEYRVEDEDHVRSHLWLLRLRDRKILKLTHGRQYHLVDFDWHPRGEAIAFESWPSPDESEIERGQIYVLDLNTLGITLLSKTGCSRPRWSPEGGRLAFLNLGEPTFIANNTIRIVLFEGQPSERQTMTGSEATIEPREANVREAAAFLNPAPLQFTVPVEFDEELVLEDWGLTGLYCSALQRTGAHLFRVEPETGKITRLTPDSPPGWFSLGASLTPDDRVAALVAGNAEQYYEVVTLDLASGAVKQLTRYNELTTGWQVAQGETITWKSRDGVEIEGVLFKPADFEPGKKFPLLVALHGGPTWVSLQARLVSSYERRLYPLQEWAARGALILQPNYRGSGGYGEAFRSLNVRNLGLGDYEDVIAGVDALVERGWVDPQRVGVMGWSQGGYISAFCATYASERFSAASVGAGISNWVTYYVNTDIHPFTRQYLEASPWEDMEVYRSTSPITYLERAKTPALILHGQNDRRVPLPNAYELYQGLRDMGVETRLVTYPGMGHGPSRPRVCRQIMQENLRWFNRWIFEQPAQDTSEVTCYVALAGVDTAQPGENLSPYIQEVIRQARRDGVEFCLFSQDGLVRAVDPALFNTLAIPPEAVLERARQVTEQLKAENVCKLVVFTLAGRQNAPALIGLSCLHLAAGLVEGVELEQRTVEL
jgi:dipeptidyl aminopeptidase/acylaminoacyl peptidase